MLTEAINDAIKTEGTVPPPAEVETKVEETTEELTEQEIADAKALFKSLKDPNTRGGIVQVLAQHEGLIQQQVEKAETKAEIKEVKDDILEAILEAYGKDLEFLAEPTAKALKAVVSKLVDAQVKDVREKLEQTEVENSNAEIGGALDQLYLDFPEAKKFEKQMYEEMENISPSANIKPYDYFKKIYALVSGKTPEKAQPKKETAGPLSRLGGMRSNSSDGESANTGKMSLKDAVQAALESQSKKG